MAIEHSSTLIPFDYNGTHVPVQINDDGQPWWEAEGIRNALAPSQGLHTILPQPFFSLLDVLGIAAALPEKKTAWSFLTWISVVATRLSATSPTFWEIYGAIACQIAWNASRLTDEDDEFYWHQMFLKHLNMLIPGASLASKPRIQGVGIPDFMVKIGTDICPVEIKTGTFKQAARRQLRRYIQGYEAPYGFAVAQYAQKPLDTNMIFLSLEGLS